MKILSFISIIFIMLVSCKDKISNNIRISGYDYNNSEFKKVIDYYKGKSDTLKLKSAIFLMENMDGKYFLHSHYLTALDSITLLIPNPTIKRLEDISDSLKTIYPMGYTIQKDINIISAEYLIQNIEYSFIAWRMPWAKHLSFEDFCEFILPYKSGNEKPELWRKSLLKRYSWVLDSVKSDANRIEACKVVNQELKSWFNVNLTYNYPVDIGFNMANKIKVGVCDCASKMSLYPMKALGIPVVVDFTPQYANRSKGHSWNALILPNNQVSCFVGAESFPGLMKEFIAAKQFIPKMAKVFRKTYAKQNSLLLKKNEGENIPPFFKDSYIKDVTDIYMPVSDVIIKFKQNLNQKFVYLCVFDNKNWQPIHWSEVNNGEATFTKMGRDVAYLPIFVENGQLMPAGNPFILDIQGNIKILKANESDKRKIKLLRKYPEDESNVIFTGENYEVFYWSDGWKSMGKQEATSTFLIYDNAPSNGLFWIRNLDKGKQERIFTIDNNQQVWW
jgi:hypothetical protein